ncbi:MAG: transporter related protein [Thermoleophilia bacterium]|nr:transporter related protein [Thermoleophilia bacterium]
MAELVASGIVVEHRSRAGVVRSLAGVDVTVASGDVLAVMGGTGAGKSTLARVLVGIESPTSGTLGGAALGGVRMVLQRPEASFLEARVLDEVMLAALAGGAPRAEADRRARGLLDLLGLPADIADRDPLALSGGEQRRVAIAAVLSGDPAVTILDEPSAGLDSAARGELHQALLALRTAGRTMVVITHDPAEAALLGTRLVVLADGRVAWDGAADAILGDPATARRAGIDVAPEVTALHEVAHRLGASPGAPSADPAAAIAQLAQVLRASSTPVGDVDRSVEGFVPVQPHVSAATGDAEVGPALAGLPPRVDARLRILACAFAIVAALAASSLVGAALVAAAAAGVVAAADIAASRVRLAVRPLIGLTIALVALQLLVAPGADAPLVHGSSIDVPAAPALLRALQAAGIVLATLALSAATAPVDLAAAMRWWLAPLRLLRIPVDAAAFIVATGLGLVPVLADELERLRAAQRARGLRPAGSRRPLTRLRADAQLLTPLVVGAFRHAHQLADALVLRGLDPDARVLSWRPRVRPPADLLLAAGGIALLVVSRFA